MTVSKMPQLVTGLQISINKLLLSALQNLEREQGPLVISLVNGLVNQE